MIYLQTTPAVPFPYILPYVHTRYVRITLFFVCFVLLGPRARFEGKKTNVRTSSIIIVITSSPSSYSIFGRMHHLSLRCQAFPIPFTKENHRYSSPATFPGYRNCYDGYVLCNRVIQFVSIKDSQGKIDRFV